VGENQLLRLESGFERWGDWVLVTTRAVPVLAEASTLAAGVARMPFGRFVGVTTLANAGISAVYSAVGAYAATTSSFLLALSAAVVVPGVMLIFTTRGNAERRRFSE
jgi:3-dehydroquinate synthase